MMYRALYCAFIIRSRRKAECGFKNKSRLLFPKAGLLHSQTQPHPSPRAVVRNISAPGGARTPNPQFRRLMLYPIELQAQGQTCQISQIVLWHVWQIWWFGFFDRGGQRVSNPQPSDPQSDALPLSYGHHVQKQYSTRSYGAQLFLQRFRQITLRDHSLLAARQIPQRCFLCGVLVGSDDHGERNRLGCGVL